jgi:hypothetical protein
MGWKHNALPGTKFGTAGMSEHGITKKGKSCYTPDPGKMDDPAIRSLD